MELLQILHKNIPQKNKILELFRKQQSQDITKFLLQIIKSVKTSTKDIRMINSFCIEIYDMLYYYIMFDKIKVAKKVLRLLEELALPLKYIGEDKRAELLKKICKIKL